MRYERVTTVFLAAVVTATAAFGQTLAEVARKEDERRKAIATPARVYTNNELRADASAARPASVPAPGTTTEAAPAPAGVASPGGAGASAAAKPTEDPKKNEAHWRQRMQQARDAMQRAEVVVAALQSRIDALSADFVNRDDPAQRARIATDRDTAIQELERLKKEMQQFAKATTGIQDEARRAGVPPGWVR